MSLWIFATLWAALVQALRFMLQKRLKTAGLSTAAATLARFIWASPVAALGIWGYAQATGTALPSIPAAFWPQAIAGGLGQIVGTGLVVGLFNSRNFAVGITLMKSEVMITAVAGMVLLGEVITPLGFGAIAIGLVGVLVMSLPERGWGRLVNRATVYGLGSGVAFTVASLCFREATLMIDSPDPLIRAGVTLAWATLLQTLALGAWMLWRDRAGLRALGRNWRATALVGLASVAGSMGWFTAFTLQTAAYVKALGQIELLFTVLISALFFGERTTAREGIGMALLTASVLLLLLAL